MKLYLFFYAEHMYDFITFQFPQLRRDGDSIGPNV